MTDGNVEFTPGFNVGLEVRDFCGVDDGGESKRHGRGRTGDAPLQFRTVELSQANSSSIAYLIKSKRDGGI